MGDFMTCHFRIAAKRSHMNTVVLLLESPRACGDLVTKRVFCLSDFSCDYTNLSEETIVTDTVDTTETGK